MFAERRLNLAIGAVVTAFIILSAAYSIANPLHEATDELRPYRFIPHLVQRRSLPVQGAMECSAQGHHPPLYYAAAALATSWIDTGRDICYEPQTNPFWAYNYWEIGVDNKNQYLHRADEAFPWSGEALAAHLSRFVNILVGAGVVSVTYLIGRTVWPTRPFLALGGASIIAFNPMFLYMAGAINNDVIAALAGAAVTLGCVRLMRDENGLGWRWGVILGALYGLALLSKFNLAAIIITIELAVTWVAWRRKQWREWMQVNLLIAGVALLLAGWWFLRNQMLYGEPTGFERLTELWGVRDPRDSFDLAIAELPYVWTSLWGRFGYGQIPLPRLFYDVLGLVAVVALAGLALPLLQRDREELRESGPYLLLLLANVGLFFAVIFNYLLVSPAGPMGRFFFPALPSLALLLSYGLSRWVALMPVRQAPEDEADPGQRRGIALTAVLTASLFIAALIALFGYLMPAFARPQAYADAEIANHTNVSFGNLVALKGFEINQDTVSAGDDVEVTLYWEVTGKPPGDYLEFVHLIDEQGLMIAQRDTHPGLGRFPAGDWSPGDRFKETIALRIPDAAYTPSSGVLSVGLYAPVEGYRLGVYGPDGALLGDAFALGDVSLVPTQKDTEAYPNLMEQNFANKLMLVGYEYDRRQVAPGEELGITLYWKALADKIPDYEVQLRLLDETGWVMETYQERPQMGTASTSEWSVGEIITDRHVLPISPAITPGVYRLQLALQRSSDNERPPIIHEDGRWISDKLRLADIRIAP